MENYIEQQLLLGKQEEDASHSDIDYNHILSVVQQHIVKNKLPELTNALLSNNFSTLKSIVADYLSKEENIFEKIYADRIIDDMTGFGFLNKYFAKKDEIEEININAWNSIEVRYCDGHSEMIDEHFNSPQQSRDILLRILRLNNKHIDENNLYSVSYIGKEVRIACAVYPLVDKETGIAASIRFIHSAVFTLPQLVKVGMLNKDMAEMLNLFINHGCSICFCGGTGSGKTTVANALLEDMPDSTRIITLEDGTREFDLLKQNEQGKIVNDRLHLITRPSKNAEMNVDLQTLLDLILKFDPDVVAVGEMVSEEAFIAAETARTGHTVVSTIHTKNAFAAYHRMFTLGSRKFRFDESIMMQIMVEAFPIIVYTKRYEDGVRRVQTILEGQYVDNQVKFNELYHFKVNENVSDSDTGKKRVIGVYEKVNSLSETTKNILLDNGVENAVINNF